MKKENNYIIYKATNTANGFLYVGATTDSVESRKKDHECKSQNESDLKFHKAISTYGADSFNWEQIDTASSMDELAQKETHYILASNSQEEGYNSDRGGGVMKSVYQYNVTDGSLIKKYSQLESAASSVSATKQRISSVCLSVNQTYKGFYWSYDYKIPYKPHKDERRKVVIQYDLKENLLAEYNSVSEASEKSGFSKSCIAKVCREERSTSGGFIWKYK